ncbi:hypothetical protein TcWFU_001262 [Taenia crassiceps]|uniref:Uncharacterized protein n=1 Tax=Taenia crassiceps TaxID=6207 RepID=A0ABR4QNU6_9CEST
MLRSGYQYSRVLTVDFEMNIKRDCGTGSYLAELILQSQPASLPNKPNYCIPTPKMALPSIVVTQTAKLAACDQPRLVIQLHTIQRSDHDHDQAAPN